MDTILRRNREVLYLFSDSLSGKTAGFDIQAYSFVLWHWWKPLEALPFHQLPLIACIPPRGVVALLLHNKEPRTPFYNLESRLRGGGVLKINQPRCGMMMRDRVLSTWTGWLHDESQWLCFYNSIVEGQKQNKSRWWINITHRSFQWPRAHGVEFMRTHTHAHTNTHIHAHAHLSLQVTGRAGFWWILDSCFTLSYQSNYLWHVSQNIYYVHTRSNSHTHLRSGSLRGPTLNPHNPITWYTALKTAGGPDLKKTKVGDDEERLWWPWLGISYHQAKGHAWYAPHAMPPSAQAIDTPLIFLSVSIFYDRMPSFPRVPASERAATAASVPCSHRCRRWARLTSPWAMPLWFASQWVPCKRW